MVMWNLVGHGVKWSIRGIYGLSQTESGKKSVEVASSVYKSSKLAVMKMVQERESNAEMHRTRVRGGKFHPGATVITVEGLLGIVLGYLSVSDLDTTSSDQTLTQFVVVDLLSFRTEEDRYQIISDTQCRLIE
jgi:hypothetical protein